MVSRRQGKGDVKKKGNIDENDGKVKGRKFPEKSDKTIIKKII